MRRHPSRAWIRKTAGFDIDLVIPRIMRDFHFTRPVVFTFDAKDQDYDQGKSPYAGAARSWDGETLEISLPSDATLKKYMPDLSASLRRAKQIASVCEEISHGNVPETCHYPRIVNPIIKCIRKHVPKRDLRSEFMRDRIATLKEVARNPELDTCSDRVKRHKRK